MLRCVADDAGGGGPSTLAGSPSASSLGGGAGVSRGYGSKPAKAKPAVTAKAAPAVKAAAKQAGYWRAKAMAEGGGRALSPTQSGADTDRAPLLGSSGSTPALARGRNGGGRSLGKGPGSTGALKPVLGSFKPGGIQLAPPRLGTVPLSTTSTSIAPLSTVGGGLRPTPAGSALPAFTPLSGTPSSPTRKIGGTKAGSAFAAEAAYNRGMLGRAAGKTAAGTGFAFGLGQGNLKDAALKAKANALNLASPNGIATGQRPGAAAAAAAGAIVQT